MDALQPCVSGKFDGVHLWAQWNDADPARGYCARYRLRRIADRMRSADADYGQWIALQGGGRLEKPWFCIATHAEGARAQLQVARFDADPAKLEWEQAMEAAFARSRCLFEIQAGRTALLYPKGTSFHAMVDGAGCSYELEQEVEVAAGALAQVEMVAMHMEPWCQLDRPDHFVRRPQPGLVIRNLAPSTSDLASTGRDFTEIVRQAKTGPLVLVFGDSSTAHT